MQKIIHEEAMSVKSEEDLILIEDEEDHDLLEEVDRILNVLNYALVSVGVLIFSISILVWRATYIINREPEPQQESPCLVIMVGLIAILHGLIGITNPPNSYNLEVIINENQVLDNLPLREVIVASMTTVIGISGLAFMTLIDTYSWTDWNILGFITSIFLLLALPYLTFKLFLKGLNQIELPKFQLSGDLLMRAVELRTKYFLECLLLMVGILCCLQAIILWTITWILDDEKAVPVILLLGGIIVIFQSLIKIIKPHGNISLQVIINDKTFSTTLPLRHVLVSTVHTIIGISGLISMCTVGPYYRWSLWNILGILTSFLLLLSVPYFTFKLHSKQTTFHRNNDDLKDEDNLENEEGEGDPELDILM